MTADPRLSNPPLRPFFEAAEERWLAKWGAGPTRRSWSTIPPQAGAPAPSLALHDSRGASVQLHELWQYGPALLLFWRHWGCGCGTARAERLREEWPKLEATGATVVVIGQGEPERAAWYADTFKLPCRVLCDTDESAYQQYGLLEMSPWLLLGEAKPPMTYFEKLITKHRELGRPVADNPFLLPGEFVVDRTGRLVLTYRYQYCDNFPDIETLLDSIAEANEAKVPAPTE